MTPRRSVADMTQEEVLLELQSKGIPVDPPAKALVPVKQTIALIPMKQKQPAKPKKRAKAAVTPGSNHPIAVAGVIQATSQSGLAWKFFDGINAVWLPKSQCQWDEEQQAMIMPEWLAYEKKLI